MDHDPNSYRRDRQLFVGSLRVSLLRAVSSAVLLNCAATIAQVGADQEPISDPNAASWNIALDVVPTEAVIHDIITARLVCRPSACRKQAPMGDTASLANRFIFEVTNPEGQQFTVNTVDASGAGLATGAVVTSSEEVILLFYIGLEAPPNGYLLNQAGVFELRARFLNADGSCNSVSSTAEIMVSAARATNADDALDALDDIAMAHFGFDRVSLEKINGSDYRPSSALLQWLLRRHQPAPILANENPEAGSSVETLDRLTTWADSYADTVYAPHVLRFLGITYAENFKHKAGRGFYTVLKDKEAKDDLRELPEYARAVAFLEAARRRIALPDALCTYQWAGIELAVGNLEKSRDLTRELKLMRTTTAAAFANELETALHRAEH